VSAVLTQPTDDQRDFILGDFQVITVGPEASRVKVLERLACEFYSPCPFVLLCLNHAEKIYPPASIGKRLNPSIPGLR
jgi:hypothetical protein